MLFFLMKNSGKTQEKNIITKKLIITKLNFISFIPLIYSVLTFIEFAFFDSIVLVCIANKKKIPIIRKTLEKQSF